MSQPTRLFDCLQLFLESPIPDQLCAKVGGVWKKFSSIQVNHHVQTLGAALYKHGISINDGTTEGRDKVGIISASRPEWIITDLAVQQTGAILVPVYPNTHVEQLRDMFNEAAVKIVFTDTKERYDLITSLMPDIPSIEAVYVFDEADGCPSYTQLMQEATDADISRVKHVASKVKPDDVTTIIYTSGTTGRPKGVMLTHRNILSNVKSSESVLNRIPLERKKALSFLPLNHIFEKMIAYVYLFNGFSIYYAENMDSIGANLKEVKPTLFVSVPRLLEKVYERIMAEGEKLKGIKKTIFYWAVSLAERFRLEQGGSQWYQLQMFIADKLVFSKWRNAIGGRVGAIVVGGAACQVRLEKLFCAAGIPIMEGYGLTETSPVIAVNDYAWGDRMFGTVGSVIKGVKVKIDKDGEILVKGPNVMVGYYKNPELTAEVLTDGWFHTGDIGEFVANRFLKITDRKKEIFKTSGGKFVAPLPIENKMKENPLIEQMMVIGPGRKFVAALIVPSFVGLKAWCEKQGIPYNSAASAVKDPRVIKFFDSLIAQYNPGFNHVEQVKRFTLLPQEWSIENGELTPKLSLRRKVIMDHYEHEIEELYHDEHELNPELHH